MATERLGEHAHLIRSLELDGVLDRALEFLPSAEEIEERHRAGKGLTRPELAMLLSYSKIALNNQLMLSDVPEDPYLSGELDRYFPAPAQPALRASCWASTGCGARSSPPPRPTASSTAWARPSCRAPSRTPGRTPPPWRAPTRSPARRSRCARCGAAIEGLDNKVAAATQYAMTLDTVTLIRQVTYWLIQRHRGALGIDAQVARLRPGIRELAAALPQWLHGLERDAFDQQRRATRCGTASRRRWRGTWRPAARSRARPTSSSWRRRTACRSPSRRAPTSASAASSASTGCATRIEDLDIQGHWQAVARGSLREALYDAHRGLTERVLRETRERDPARAVQAWIGKHAVEAEHARSVVNDIRAQPSVADFASLSVALQALRRLAVAER